MEMDIDSIRILKIILIVGGRNIKGNKMMQVVILSIFLKKTPLPTPMYLRSPRRLIGCLSFLKVLVS